MISINERSIRNLTSKGIYERGEDYYLKGNVLKIDVKTIKDNESGFEVLLIKGKVKSDNSNKIYDSSVSITMYGGIINVNCDCQAFMNYFPSVGMCKHVVAILLKYVKEKDKIITAKGSKDIQRLINSLGIGVISSNDVKKEINLNFIYEHKSFNSGLSSLELKAGESNLYVVKDIKEFIEAVINKDKVISFGINFTFNPKIHKFKEEDKKIIETLKEVYEIDKGLKAMGRISQMNTFFKGKKAYITDSHIKKILNNLKGRNITFKSNQYETINALVLEKDIPLEFSMYMENEHIFLKQKGPSPIFLTKDMEYVYYNKRIYNPSKEQMKIFGAIYNLYNNSKDSMIKFNLEDKEALASYILPTIKKISYDINVDPMISKDFYEKPLNVKFYLDKYREGISTEIKFSYGNLDINPLTSKQIKSGGGFLVRDIIEETRIIKSLLKLGFEKHSGKFILREEGKVINFISNQIEELCNLGEVYYSEEFKDIKVYSTPKINSSIKINNNNNLLEFHFDIEGLEREELRDIFNAIKEKKKYYKLKKGGFIPIESKELENFSNMIEYLNIKDSDFQKEKMLLSPYNALYIDEVSGEDGLDIDKDKAFENLINNIKEVKELTYEPSENLSGIMRQYQKFGFKWLKTLASCGFGGILADEMGLGKTLQAIAFIESEAEKEDGPSLVVAPTSLVYNWKDEIEKFAPNIKTLIISGDKRERREKLKIIENYQVVITSYPLIRRDVEEYSDIMFKYCFLDEAQYIKNPNSINARSVKELKAKAYFALTGTPIENSLTELWSIFDFIMPGYLMSHSKFLQKYEIPIIKSGNEKALEELNKHIKPFILRRMKKDVIQELPPKIEHKILIEMTKEQKKLYAAYLTQFKEDMAKEIKEKGFRKSRFKILSMLTRLRQICDDPSIFIENYKGDNGKMEVLDDLLGESLSSGHRILLFSQFTSVLKSIEKRLVKNKIEYMYLDGNTHMEDRMDLVNRFNGGKGEIFLISLKAGGTGLNLTGADTVIHFDPWWNPAVEEQATDRAHRIGQKNTVEVIKLITRGSIEEKIYNLQQKKKIMIDNVINREENNSLISQMTEDEIKELFV